jgi:transcription initiation factor IIE alpha subunit
VNREQQIMEVIGDTGATREQVSEALSISAHYGRDILRVLRDKGMIGCVNIRKVPTWFKADQVEARQAAENIARQERVRLKRLKDNTRFRAMRKIRGQGQMAGEERRVVIRKEWEPVRVAGPRSVFELA